MKKLTVAEKIISKHIVTGVMKTGEEIGLHIDQTLTQDATGTLAYLQFEALGIPRVKTTLSVSYVDHNMLQSGFENADDHRYLQTVAAKYGIYFSRPGNGICHQVHLERFGIPGETLLGSDSHTPTGGGLGMIAIGAGGLNVAVAMGGGPFYLNMPQIIKVELTGKLSAWINAKDVILEILRRLTVKGGVGKIYEFCGEGVKTLSVPERATITNMGAELGATTSLFPSDLNTKKFLQAQGRVEDWKEITADPGAGYADTLHINLSKIEPMVAKPHMPDNVVRLRELAGLPVDQVCIGSCTNSSLKDLMITASILKNKKINKDLSLIVSPGSKAVFEMIAKNGALADMISAGARIAESSCGFCIGMGHAPASDAVSLRTNNRNFEGRSGTKSAEIYIVSPEAAAYSALSGKLADPRKLGKQKKIKEPVKYIIDDSGIIKPSKKNTAQVVRGPNIKPLPIAQPLADEIELEVLLKVGDNITTDHIMPAGAKILPLRSNIPAISKHVFAGIDQTFAERALEKGGGIIVGKANYGQGSSREHAALAPMYLKIKAVIVKSFARIHRNNLINFGIVPLTFSNESEYDTLEQGDVCLLQNMRKYISYETRMKLINKTKNKNISINIDLIGRERKIILAGGLLNFTKNK
ncbi:MAG: aconitate hydratase [bacterium]